LPSILPLIFSFVSKAKPEKQGFFKEKIKGFLTLHN